LVKKNSDVIKMHGETIQKKERHESEFSVINWKSEINMWEKFNSIPRNQRFFR